MWIYGYNTDSSISKQICLSLASARGSHQVCTLNTVERLMVFDVAVSQIFFYGYFRLLSLQVTCCLKPCKSLARILFSQLCQVSKSIIWTFESVSESVGWYTEGRCVSFCLKLKNQLFYKDHLLLIHRFWLK